MTGTSPVRDTVTIRPAHAGDADAVQRLAQHAYRGSSGRASWAHDGPLADGERIAPDEVAAILADNAQQVLVAVRRDAVIGCVQLSVADADTVALGLLCVALSWQAAGLGSRLIAAAEAAARARPGVRAIELNVVTARARLIAFYERRGFRQTGERRPYPFVTDPPAEFAVMRKRLDGMDAPG